MKKVVIEELPNGQANAFFRGKVWKRETEYGEYGLVPRWYRVSSDNRALSSAKCHRHLEDSYKSGDYKRKIHRFLRLAVTDEYADLNAIPTISQIEANRSRWLVEGMILQGSINLLTAPPGGFKS
ncbi:MAG: hypothetical protein ABR953_08045 [Candidatus Acidiferrales bacterium]|jgi:hypothetical protein